jgi:hypothetical protein
VTDNSLAPRDYSLPEKGKTREERELLKYGQSEALRQLGIKALTEHGIQATDDLRKLSMETFNSTVEHHLEYVEQAKASGDPWAAQLVEEFAKLSLEDGATQYRKAIDEAAGAMRNSAQRFGSYTPPPKGGWNKGRR